MQGYPQLPGVTFYIWIVPINLISNKLGVLCRAQVMVMMLYSCLIPGNHISYTDTTIILYPINHKQFIFWCIVCVIVLLVFCIECTKKLMIEHECEMCIKLVQFLYSIPTILLCTELNVYILKKEETASKWLSYCRLDNLFPNNIFVDSDE